MKLEELCAAVQEARYYNERFTRREYTSAFRTYTERFGPLYMEAVRETAEDPDGRRVLAEQLLDLLEAGWKRQRPWNRTMVQAREKQMLVTYLSPMLLGLEEPLCQELAERLRDGWNTRRPKDIYNITTYARLQEGFRNVKNDATGQWEKVPIYTFDDPLPYGHGEKSVYIVNGFLRLTREEAMAIRWHMGFSGPEDARTVGQAFQKYPLAFALATADMEASYFLEGDQ